MLIAFCISLSTLTTSLHSSGQDCRIRTIHRITPNSIFLKKKRGLSSKKCSVKDGLQNKQYIINNICSLAHYSFTISSVDCSPPPIETSMTKNSSLTSSRIDQTVISIVILIKATSQGKIYLGSFVSSRLAVFI